MSAALVEYEPIRDTRHRSARSAGELVDWLAWLDVGGYAPSTLDGYERTCADLLNAYPDLAFEDFTDTEVLAVLRRYPAKSRRIRKAHLASWFKWGYRTRRIPANPVDMLPTIKRTPQPIIDVFTPAEQQQLEQLPLPDGPLMMLLFEAGLRRAEACQMRLARVDLQRGRVTVSDGAKGGKDRLVPMVPQLRYAIANLELVEGLDREDFLWYDKPGGGFAVRVRRSKAIAVTSFGRWWARCLAAAEVAYRKPHTARHTFATRWRERGLESDDLQALLGHSSVKTTMDTYVHTTVDRLEQRMFALLEAE